MMRLISFLVVFNTFFWIQSQENQLVNDTLTIVYFEYDSADLTENAKNKIDKVVLPNTNDKIYIDGYTDTVGTKSYNEKLSEDRAKNVAKLFNSKGVSDSLMLVKSKGKLHGVNDDKARSVFVYKKKAVKMKDSVIREELKPEPLDDWERAKIERERKYEEERKRKEAIEAEKKADLLDELAKGGDITIEGIEFVPGESTLMDYSKPALLSLLELLEENPDLKVEIQGHICCSKQYEGLDQKTGKYNLSEMRAKSVYEILINNGIDKKRLTYKGYGNSRPLYPEDSYENMQRNRRVSIQVVTE